ncbi:hypothetical protein BDV98DRAFT_568467 [Pterulicium gracile]|uniref:Uncharacterized protein n=1 Tax=Pterulicium gracile TaxID=1884261 RepID=A0A5C3QG88_9AGAR|nr:hypothetical protein BDV98DRAFT_568467 [Pterula gracilis]
MYLKSKDGYGISNQSLRQYVRINEVAEHFGGTVRGPYINDAPTRAERTEFRGVTSLGRWWGF